MRLSMVQSSSSFSVWGFVWVTKLSHIQRSVTSVLSFKSKVICPSLCPKFSREFPDPMSNHLLFYFKKFKMILHGNQGYNHNTLHEDYMADYAVLFKAVVNTTAWFCMLLLVMSVLTAGLRGGRWRSHQHAFRQHSEANLCCQVMNHTG